MLHIELIRMEHEPHHACKWSARLHSLDPCIGSNVQKIFSEEGYVAYHNGYAIKMFYRRHIPDLLGWEKKVRH